MRKMLAVLVCVCSMCHWAVAGGGGGITKTWTGAVDSDWNEDGNWDPVGVPGIFDWAQIESATVTFSSPVEYNGRLSIRSSTIDASAQPFTLGPASLTEILGVSSLTLISGTVTNEGEVAVTAPLYLSAAGTCLVNAAGGTVALQEGGGIFDYYGGACVVNEGTIAGDSGSAASFIYPYLTQAGAVDVRSGTLYVQKGVGDGLFSAASGATLTLSDFALEPGAQFAGEGTRQHAGGAWADGLTVSNLMVTGTVELRGHATCHRVALDSAGVLGGTGAVLSGELDWSCGRIGRTDGEALTFDTNAVVTVAGSWASYPLLMGSVTNAGQIVLGDSAPLVLWSAASRLVNTPQGEMALGDGSIVNYYWSAFGIGAVENFGLVHKPAGSGQAQLYVDCVNGGTVCAESGVIALDRGEGDGVFLADAGSQVALNNYVIRPGAQFGGDGTRTLGGGTLCDGLVVSNLDISGSAELLGHVAAHDVRLSGTLSSAGGVLSGELTWLAGAVGSDASDALTLAEDGALLVSGGGERYLQGVVTNAGLLRVSSACTLMFWSHDTRLVNLPDAEVDFAADAAVNYYWSAYGIGTVENWGFLHKSGGGEQATLYVNCDNFGTVSAETGGIGLMLGQGNGAFLAAAAAEVTLDNYALTPGVQFGGGGSLTLRTGTLADGIVVSNLCLSGLVTLSGAAEFQNVEQRPGARLSGHAGAVTGSLRVTGGQLGDQATDALTFANGCFVEIEPAATVYVVGAVTNEGHVALGDASTLVLWDGGTRVINAPSGLLEAQGGAVFNYYWIAYGVGALENRGLLLLADGQSLSCYVDLFNHGTVDLRTGALAMDSDDSRTFASDGRWRFGLASAARHGLVTCASPVDLCGTVEVESLEGYAPPDGSSVALITASSGLSGSFAAVAGPSCYAWEPIYGATDFSLVAHQQGMVFSPTLGSFVFADLPEGREWTIQYCTNLVEHSWQDLMHHFSTGERFLITDPGATNRPSCFYRAVETAP